MADLTQRLRDEQVACEDIRNRSSRYGEPELYGEAADTIDRLTTENERLQAVLTKMRPHLSFVRTADDLVRWIDEALAAAAPSEEPIGPLCKPSLVSYSGKGHSMRMCHECSNRWHKSEPTPICKRTAGTLRGDDRMSEPQSHYLDVDSHQRCVLCHASAEDGCDPSECVIAAQTATIDRLTDALTKHHAGWVGECGVCEEAAPSEECEVCEGLGTVLIGIDPEPCPVCAAAAPSEETTDDRDSYYDDPAFVDGAP